MSSKEPKWWSKLITPKYEGEGDDRRLAGVNLYVPIPDLITMRNGLGIIVQILVIAEVMRQLMG